jgi:hypothetical protein
MLGEKSAVRFEDVINRKEINQVFNNQLISGLLFPFREDAWDQHFIFCN